MPDAGQQVDGGAVLTVGAGSRGASPGTRGSGVGLVALVAFVFSLAGPLRAAPTDLDASFGDDGVALAPTDARTWFTRIITLQDGRIIAASVNRIVRFAVDGSLDTSFGGGLGYVPLSAVCGDIPTALRCDSLGGLALQPDGKIVGAVNARLPDTTFVFGVARFNADGSPDLGFGSGGLVQLPANGMSDFARGALFVLPDGRLQVIGSSWANGQLPSRPLLSCARFLADGSPDPTFGTQGRVVGGIAVSPNAVAVAQAADGKWLVAASGPLVTGAPSPLLIARLSVDCAADPTFGSAGSALYPPLSLSPIGAVAVTAQPDGKVLVAGSLVGVTAPPQFAIVRSLQDGGLDPTFGSAGVVSIRVGESGGFGAGQPGTYSDASSILVQTDGSIVVGGTVYQNMDDLFPVSFPRSPFLLQRAGLARLLPDGTPDLQFAGGGVATAWVGFGANAYALALQPDGRIVAAGDIQLAPTPPGADPLSGWLPNPTPAVFRFRGGKLDRPLATREADAIEYFDAEFGHYFVTSAAKEIVALDTVRYAARWARTGLAFKVWTESAADLLPVCRFFSDQTFAPRSSHFYTPYADECSALSHGDVWHFEGLAFLLKIPGSDSACPVGSIPLYRVYNGGQGGAPNHRFTTDRAVRDAMIASGWVAEGSGPDAVATCAPAD